MLVELVVQALVLGLRNCLFGYIGFPQFFKPSIFNRQLDPEFEAPDLLVLGLPPSPCLAVVVKINREDPILNDLKCFQSLIAERALGCAVLPRHKVILI